MTPAVPSQLELFPPTGPAPVAQPAWCDLRASHGPRDPRIVDVWSDRLNPPGTGTVTGPKPLTRQRSPWRHAGTIATGPGHAADVWERRVSDGTLRALVSEEPPGWHLSRYPRWDEITDARERLLPAEVGFVMHLPPTGQYVAVHETTFHLWEHPERQR